MTESIIESTVEVVVDSTEEVPVRVLHVDDEAGFLKVAKQCLEMQGVFQIETVSSVDEALKKMKKKVFDVIISDYQMPEKDGLEFLKELRGKGNTVSFIMFTGRGREEVAVRALNLGADQYLNKTGDPEAVYGELAHAIRKIVKAKHDEERVRTSEEKYRSLFENAKDVTLTLDLKGNITSINKAAIKYGFKKDEIIGKNMLKYTPKKYWLRLLKELAQIARGKTVEGNIEIITPKGKKNTEYISNPIIIGNKAVGVQSVLKDVTERKKMREAVEKARDDYLAVTNLTGDIIVKADKGGKWTFLNDGACKFWGMSGEKLLGSKFADYLHPDDQERTTAAVQKSIETKEMVRGVTNRQKTPKGWRTVEWNAIPLFDEAGNYVEMQATGRDITERKRIEDKLRSILESSPDAITVTDLEGTITECNDATLKIHGFSSKEEVVGKNAFMLFPEREQKRARENLKRTLEQGIVRNVEYNLLMKEGREFSVELSASVVKDSSGTPVAFVAVTKDITEHKKSEARIRASEEKYRSLVELAPNGIVTLDTKGVITSRNTAATKISGFSKGELIGKHFSKLADLRGQDVQEFLKLFGSVLKGEVTEPFDVNLRHKDGTPYTAEVSTGLLKEDGKTMGVQVIFRDITGRKKIEEKTKKVSEEWMKTFDAISDLVFIIDKNFRLLRVNKAFCDALKKRPEDLIGKRCFEVVHGTDEPWHNCPNVKTLATRKAATEEIDDSNLGIPLLVTISPILDEKGELTGCMHIGKDIGGLKKALDELKDSEERLKILFEFAPDAYYLNDLKGNFVDGNIAAEDLTGYSRSELVGKSFLKLKLLPRKQVMKAAKLLVKNALGKPTGPDEFVLNRKDGTPVPVEIRTFPIKIKNQTLVLGIARDISERKSAEVALKTMNEKLRVVGKLTQHDVRNKLSGITGNVFLTRQKLTGDHEAMEYLREIESATSQIERIFDFARIYEKLSMEKLAYINVEKTLKEAVIQFSGLHSVRMANDCHGLTILADSLLRQLFYNLIHNSLRHGEKVVQIRVHYEEVGKDQLNLVYEDDGVGIPKAEKEKIFEKGYGKGTGYGLYLIRKICGVYGWTIRETGKPGKGAQFTITIPRLGDKGKILYRLH